ncbi:MAG: diphosphatase [Pseudomonadota bacterium]|jgi:NAD+ diphosphatase
MHFTPSHHPPAEPTATAWCFAFVQRDLLLPVETPQSLARVEAAELHRLGTLTLSRHYLGRLAGQDCWAAELPDAPDGWQRTGLRAAMLALDAPIAALAGRAAQVLEWDRSHRYCGVCGTPTEHHPGERSRVCPNCGHTAYPRLSPAMMALVWRPGELLLARSPHYAPGMYSALAGFVEAGESIEDCLHREVAEEVGVQVAAPVYYGSQSWPFPHSLMVAYTARWLGGQIVPQAGEIEDARWFALDELPTIPGRFSIAGHLIRDTLALMQSGAEPGTR